jgi:ribosomal protein S12 methylthiotransferase accessory factor
VTAGTTTVTEAEKISGAARHPPIEFRGTSFRSAKAFRAGTHRTQSPDATFRLVQPYLAKAGVTRIADVTGLDHVGVPTTLALRPNAPTMACSSGKGLTLDQAYVSGAMEAIELHAAETATFSPVRASYRDLARSYPMPRVDHLPLAQHSLFTVDWPFHWCLGWDLISQSEIPVPMALVGMSKRSQVGSLRAFLVSSNGLGAGNTFLEAVASGLYEVIERDGIACHLHTAMRKHRPVPVVSDATIRSYPLVAGVLGKCDQAEVGVLVQECVVDTNVPVYTAYTYDMADRGVPVTRGYGAHLDPEIALLRAITEALQGRLNFIAGSRDDLFRSAYSRTRAGWSDSVKALQDLKAHSPEASGMESRASDSFESDIQDLLGCVRHAGLSNVVVIDLTPSDSPIFVVRVVVPGLEGYMHAGYQPGPRATSFEGKAAAS